MISRLSRRALLPAALIVVLFATTVAGAGERVVAVGDVHGSYEGLVEILGRAGLVDADAHWTG
ncbi:MAG: hypothetical protein KAJ97_08960, partial [Acidobacteria bacterium]|nr:hypothetical protein [Acidobacteriota bacterium]